MIVLVFGFSHMDIRRGGAISVVVVSSCTCRRGRVLYLYVRTDSVCNAGRSECICV